MNITGNIIQKTALMFFRKDNKKTLKCIKTKLYLMVMLTGFVTMLTSCSKNWQCPAEKGFSCKSISAIDGNGGSASGDNNGSKYSEVGNQDIHQNDTKQTTGNDSQNHKKTKGKVNKNILTNNTVDGIKIDDLSPTRTKEKIGRILITPYVSEEGNLNSGKYIYTIDEKPEWRI